MRTNEQSRQVSAIVPHFSGHNLQNLLEKEVDMGVGLSSQESGLDNADLPFIKKELSRG